MFFILSTGRAGSRTISNVLSQHPELVCAHEPVPHLIEETVAYRYGRLSADELSDQLRSTRPASVDGRRYGESANRLSLAVPVLAETFPDAKFIWLLRNGHEVVSSGMQRNWFNSDLIADTPWERNRLRGDELGEIDPAVWQSWPPFRRIAWLWRRTNEIIESDLSVLDSDRHLAVRLEDLGAELPAIANLLEVPNIRWVVPRLNARSRLPASGPNSANAVTDRFSIVDWTQEQRADFDAEAGQLQETWYPANSITAAADKAPLSPLDEIRVELSELRNLRVELNVVNTHANRNDRRLTDLRARNRSLQKRLDTGKDIEKALAVAKEQIEQLKQALAVAKERTEELKQGWRHVDEAREEAVARGDRLNNLLRKERRKVRSLTSELGMVRSTESYRLGHGLVRIAKFPLRVIRKTPKSAASHTRPQSAAQTKTTRAAAPNMSVRRDHDSGFADLDLLDPSVIDDGAIRSITMTLPIGTESSSAISDVHRTLEIDGAATFVIPADVSLSAIELSLTRLVATTDVHLDHDHGLLTATSKTGSSQHGLVNQLLRLSLDSAKTASEAARRATDYERQLDREKAARQRQADEFRDTTQYRLGAAVIDVAHRPTSVQRFVKEVRALQQRRKSPNVTPMAATTVEPRLNLNVMSILDEFTHDCFAPEVNLVPLDRKQWASQIPVADLVFVESAWRGNGGTWNYTVNRFDERGDHLKAILAAAHQRGIPTVFWNKEDPVSFDVFLPAAKAFDVILTTDADVVDAYKSAAGDARVMAMPFAAQPALHNPIGRPRGDDVAGRVCFAGSWRGDKYRQRESDFDTLLQPALARGALDIYDRYAGGPDEDLLGFPEPFKRAVRGSLPYSEIGTAYRSYAAFLNVNSVQESPTMFSRRVFELLACATPVISTPATGIENLLGDAVLTSDSPKRTAELVDWVINEPVERDRYAHRGYRLVHNEHTYQTRVDQLLNTAGVPFSRPRQRVTVICVSNRPDMLDHSIDSFERQNYQDKEFLFVANSSGFSDAMLNSVSARVPNARAVRVDESATLGECLNHALALSDGEYFAKFDDDDHYGDDYLSDLMITFPYSDAAVAGKQSYYAYMSRLDQTVLRFPGKEFRKAQRVVGGTIVANRAKVEGIEFQAVKRGTDTLFLEAVKSRGLRIFSADRFNFCQVRQADPNQHTWDIDEAEFLKTTEPVGSGFCESDIFL